METEENRVEIINREEDLNTNNEDNPYNFEIELLSWKKILIFILNIFTGGLGTMIEPFLTKKRSCKLVALGILLGLLQIFHILHFFSLFKEIPFFEKFYDYISDDSFLLKFVYKSKKDENNEENNGILEQLFGINNISEIIAKKERKNFLKKAFGLLSGMSYCNSIFSVIINFLKKKENEPNFKIGIKTLLYSIFNPGAGFLISSIILIDSCKCDKNKNCDIPGFWVSLFAFLLSLFLMICPYFICIGLYTMKISENNLQFYPLKFMLIFIGVIGTILSFSFSYFKKSAVIASYNDQIKPFDIVWKCGDSIKTIVSNFGLPSFIRMLLNLIIPGLGTYSIMFKYCFCCYNYDGVGTLFGYMFTSVIQLIYGGMFLYLLFTIIDNILSPKSNLNVTIPYIFHKLSDSELVITNNSVFEYLYSLTFLHYISGIFIIVISDYCYNLFDRKKNKKFFILISILILNLFTGGYGTLLFTDLLLISKEDTSKCWSFLCFCNFCCCCLPQISKMFIIGFISIIVHSHAYSSLFFYDIEMVNYASFISVVLFLIIYISTAFYFKHILNKIDNL